MANAIERVPRGGGRDGGQDGGEDQTSLQQHASMGPTYLAYGRTDDKGTGTRSSGDQHYEEEEEGRGRGTLLLPLHVDDGNCWTNPRRRRTRDTGTPPSLLPWLWVGIGAGGVVMVSL